MVLPPGPDRRHAPGHYTIEVLPAHLAGEECYTLGVWENRPWVSIRRRIGGFGRSCACRTTKTLGVGCSPQEDCQSSCQPNLMRRNGCFPLPLSRMVCQEDCRSCM